MKRVVFVAGVAAGYVLGTRAGQKRYEQIKARAERVWSSEPVQQRVEVARQTLAEKAPVVAEKVGAATRTAGSGLKDRVQGGDGPSGPSGGQGEAGSLDPIPDQMGTGTLGTAPLGSATLGQGDTGDDLGTPGTGPGGDRLP